MTHTDTRVEPPKEKRQGHFPEVQIEGRQEKSKSREDGPSSTEDNL